MTNQVNLDLVWAVAGGVLDPGDAKYTGGWIAEIPTYQNFNFVTQVATQNILALAERDSFVWQTEIAYKAGAKVTGSDGKIYHALTDNTAQDPVLDTLNNNWAHGTVLGDVLPSDLNAEEGLKLKNINLKPNTNKWDASDITIESTVPTIHMKNTSNTEKDWLFSNVQGTPVLVDLGGTGAIPDARTLALTDPSVKKIYHEDNLPTQGTAAPLDAQTSLIDATIDRLMKVGAFGLGGDSRAWPSADMNDEVPSGFYRVPSSTANNPENGFFNVIVIQAPDGAYTTQMAFNINEEGILSRTNTNGTWSAWKRIDPQAFGIGVSSAPVVPSNDLDLITISGDYYVNSSTSVNTPNSLYSWVVSHKAGITDQFCTQEVIAYGGDVPDDANEKWVRHKDSGVWEPWQRIDPQGFGLGSNIFTADANAIPTNYVGASHFNTGGTWTGSPYAGADGRNQGYLTTQAWGGGTYASQTWRSITDNEVMERWLEAGTWTAWQRTDPQAFGIGATVGISLPNANADTVPASGFYSTPAAFTGSPYSGTNGANQGTLIHSFSINGNTNYATQHFTRMQANEVWIRHKNNNTWSDWDRLVTESSMGGKPVVDFYQYQQRIELSDNNLANADGRFMVWFNGGLVMATGGGSGKWSVYSTDAPYKVTGLTLGNSGDQGTRELHNVSFSEDGLSMWTLESNGDEDYFAMTSPWDLASLSYVSTSNTGNPIFSNDFCFSPDGLTMAIASTIGSVRTCTLTTPFRPTTNTGFSEIALLNAGGTADVIEGVAFAEEGKKIVYLSATDEVLNTIFLATPWSVAGAATARGYTWEILDQVGTGMGLSFNDTGSKMQILSSAGYMVEMATSRLRIE